MNPHKLIVNVLTFARLPLVFAWFAMAVAEELAGPAPLLAFAAGVAMGLSGLTDAFDGALARRWNAVSPLGKMADPLMDKFFYVIAFPSLTWMLMHQGETLHSVVVLVFTVLYVLRDLWVTFLRSVGSLYGADGAAMFVGKLRTALSFPAAIWIYAYVAFGDWAPVAGYRWVFCASCYAVEALMIALNVVSSVTYTRAYRVYLKKALER